MAETLNQRGFVSVPITGTSVLLKDWLPDTSRWHRVLIGVAGGAIRWLANGEPPTSSFGSYVGAGGQIEWINPDVDYAGLIYNVRFIKAGVNDAELEVACFW